MGLAARHRAASDDSIAGLAGEYGFLSPAALSQQSKAEVRRRISIMAGDFGIREFQFYDWFADYSTPTSGEQWTDPYFHRMPIHRRTLQTSIDEIHRNGGRAWAYVQAIGAEEEQLPNPEKEIWKLRDAKGKWYWHPSGAAKPRFPTYFANAAWARHMVERWARPIRQLGFDGIHWDTLGRIAGDYKAEKSGMHAFIKMAHRLLREYNLRQTLNFIDLAWWNTELVRGWVEFPYAEIWSSKAADHYFAEMEKMSGLPGVLAMYPFRERACRMERGGCRLQSTEGGS